MKQTKVILENSLPVFGYMLQELVQEGWEIDPDMPPTTFGIAYEVGMMREFDESLVDQPTKHYTEVRAENAAKARASKAEKAALRAVAQ